MKKRNLFYRLILILALVFLFTGGVYAKGDEKKKETAAKADKTELSDIKVNINKAAKDELEQLEGIGPVKAEQIVAYRKKNGDFKKPEDIINVTGIGKATFEKNKDRIVLK
ncbi:helix-hairpin-helix domain-containing protein [Desulfococcaceae bacterium HSG9]|nr:helix-hairpin-helix domain-containing protein [Desulfococcaceae bacterium HSG9]